jgi:hypothetical protein
LIKREGFMKRMMVVVPMLLTMSLFADIQVPCKRCHEKEQKTEVVETFNVSVSGKNLAFDRIRRTCECGETWDTTSKGRPTGEIK